MTSAEGSSASRHARLASEDIDARGRPFDETRAVWSSVAVVAAMEALAELCAGSSAAKWKAWSDERFVAATTAALADARAHVQEWSRDGTNVTRALEEAKEAEKHEDEDEEEGGIRRRRIRRRRIRRRRAVSSGDARPVFLVLDRRS